ncbi:MAG: hypothetical protein AAFZ52_17370, partial [Bacteroidota bacterium]
PAEAATILRPYLPSHDQDIDLAEALVRTLPYCGTEQTWGNFVEPSVREFLDWLRDNGLEERPFRVAEVVTNRYLPNASS